MVSNVYPPLRSIITGRAYIDQLVIPSQRLSRHRGVLLTGRSFSRSTSSGVEGRHLTATRGTLPFLASTTHHLKDIQASGDNTCIPNDLELERGSTPDPINARRFERRRIGETSRMSLPSFVNGRPEKQQPA